jgi:ABC-type branched-subunit amino acid transport system permease subunit
MEGRNWCDPATLSGQRPACQETRGMFYHVVSAFTGLVAHVSAAAYSAVAEHHRDMCPIYVLIAFAAFLHLVVTIMQWWSAGPPGAAISQPPAATKATAANSEQPAGQG